jgi:hypothetical protein
VVWLDQALCAASSSGFREGAVTLYICGFCRSGRWASNNNQPKRSRIVGRSSVVTSISIFASFLLTAFFATSIASATTLTLGLDVEFSGGSEPVSATTPWVTITLDDSFGGANTVRMTIEASNLTGGSTGESINAFYLNFDSALDPTLLSFLAVDNADSTPNSINTGANAFQADGDGLFDIEFDMPPPPGNANSRFTGGESIVYDITFGSAIDVSSFSFASEMGGGNGSYFAAAHITRIDGNNSGWIGAPVPEPSTALLVALGMGLLSARGRR